MCVCCGQGFWRFWVLRDELDLLASRHVSWLTINLLVSKKFLSVESEGLKKKQEEEEASEE